MTIERINTRERIIMRAQYKYNCILSNCSRIIKYLFLICSLELVYWQNIELNGLTALKKVTNIIQKKVDRILSAH